MSRPILLALDDEPAVLAAVARDLRRRYGSEYRVLKADSGSSALEVLRELKLREEPVALLLVDQRMPGMSGVDFLREALVLHPGAKRVLLTAYADTQAAIQAINEVRLDHYLLKPWDPPEERLYPVLDDLLDDWRAGFNPPFGGVRVIGHRWSPASHRVKDFLSRNLIPYRWIDSEEEGEAATLLSLSGLQSAELPVLLFPDGTSAVAPSTLELASKLGLRTEAGSDFYDLVIVGAGPSGLAAAVYGASEGLRTLLVEREAPGGQAGMSSSIENYLGFPVGLSGADLARRAVAQATRFGAEILSPVEARALRQRDGYHLLTVDGGVEVASRALIVATGVSYRILDVPGAARLGGAGVYYGAAITEALAVQGREVVVVGGGNSAGQAAMYLSRFASRVTMVVRGPSLAVTMSRYLIDQIERTENIAVVTRSAVEEVHGGEFVSGVTLRQGDRGDEVHLEAAAVFIFIGAVPRTGWIGLEVLRDPQGYILTGADLVREGGRRPAGWSASRDPFWLETSVPGVFAVGDVRHRSVKRVASAVGEGSMAVQFVHQHLGAPALAAPPPVAAGG